MDKSNVHGLINTMFEEVALVLGGVISLHPMKNEAIWSLVRGFDRIRQRHLRTVDQAESNPPFARDDGTGITPHPAVEQLLLAIREDSTVDS